MDTCNNYLTFTLSSITAMVYGSRNLLWEKSFVDESQRSIEMSFFANFKGDGAVLFVIS